LPEFAELRASVAAYPVDDESIKAQIAQDDRRFGRVWCPHTATGFWAYDHLSAQQRRAAAWIVCATAHPAKFEATTEAAVGHSVPIPESLRLLLERPVAKEPLTPRLESLADALDNWTRE